MYFKRATSLSIIVTGMIAMASQIIFVREFMIVFYGNELSIAFILASWLIGGAIGSSIPARNADKLKNKITYFVSCQFAIAVLLPLTILAIRSIKSVLGTNPGEIIPIFPMAVSSFVILLPTCVILGMIFSVSCAIYQAGPGYNSTKIGSVYVLEALGSILGGLLASFVLIPAFNSVYIVCLLSVLNIAASIALLFTSRREDARKFLIALGSLMLLFGIVALFNGGWNALNDYSIAKEWKSYKLVASKNSAYGNIAITKKDAQYSIFDNGLHLYSIPDIQAAEEATHFAMLEHAKPEDVLLIGGGIGGIVKELVKYPLRTIDYVEIDPSLIKMSEDHLPWEYYKPLKDPRVSIKNADGRTFVKNSKKRYDCIIIALGNPYTAQLNRYYTVEFFLEAQKILKEGGVVSFSVISSEDYISKEQAEFLRSIYGTLKKVFKDVLVIPGNTAYFMASDERGLLTYDYSIMMDRANKRSIDLKYVREYYLAARLSREKIAYIKKVLEPEKNTKLNYDLRPISYYYDIIFWTTLFRDSVFSKILKATSQERIWTSFYYICAAIILFGFFMIRYRKSFNRISLLTIMSTGFSGIALQIIILLAFQIIYGYLFYKIGIILSAFMAGLALGGFSITRLLPRSDFRKKSLLVLTQVAISVYPIFLPASFFFLDHAKSGLLAWAGPNILFFIFPLIIGFIGGFQFPLAADIYRDNEKGAGRAGGLSYSLDLLGACLGALLTGTFLIPIIGLSNTCFMVATLNLSVLIILAASKMEGVN